MFVLWISIIFLFYLDRTKGVSKREWRAKWLFVRLTRMVLMGDSVLLLARIMKLEYVRIHIRWSRNMEIKHVKGDIFICLAVVQLMYYWNVGNASFVGEWYLTLYSISSSSLWILCPIRCCLKGYRFRHTPHLCFSFHKTLCFAYYNEWVMHMHKACLWQQRALFLSIPSICGLSAFYLLVLSCLSHQTISWSLSWLCDNHPLRILARQWLWWDICMPSPAIFFPFLLIIRLWWRELARERVSFCLAGLTLAVCIEAYNGSEHMPFMWVVYSHLDVNVIFARYHLPNVLLFLSLCCHHKTCQPAASQPVYPSPYHT